MLRPPISPRVLFCHAFYSCFSFQESTWCLCPTSFSVPTTKFRVGPTFCSNMILSLQVVVMRIYAKSCDERENLCHALTFMDPISQIFRSLLPFENKGWRLQPWLLQIPLICLFLCQMRHTNGSYSSYDGLVEYLRSVICGKHKNSDFFCLRGSPCNLQNLFPKKSRLLHK